MRLDAKLAAVIDQHRRNGASRDAIHEHLIQAGSTPETADALLNEYAESVLPDGRPRGQVNMGDPHEL